MIKILFIFIGLLFFAALFLFLLYIDVKKQEKQDQEKLEKQAAEIDAAARAQEAATHADKENAALKNNNIDTVSDFNDSIDQLRDLSQKGQSRI